MNISRHWTCIIIIAGLCAHLPITVPPASAQPPTIVGVVPDPGDRIGGPAPLDEVTLVFDSLVAIPSGAVTARTLTEGEVSVSLTSHDPSIGLTVTFPALSADVLTLVIDHTVVNGAGEALDGEVDNPSEPDLSNGTGDGEQGGPAVFQFRVLLGAVNEDDVVDIADAAIVLTAQGTCNGDAGYDARADLDGNGCIDDNDLAIVQAGLGNTLPITDSTAPFVDAVFPSPPGPLPFLDNIWTLSFSEPIDPSTVAQTSVYGVGEDGSLLSASAAPTMAGDRTFFFTFEVPECLQDHTIKVSNAIADLSGEPALPDLFEYEGEDIDPPVVQCPEATFVNSTEPLGMPADDVAAAAAIQAFLASFEAQDACTGVTVTSSLDVPVDLPLGVNTVTFTAEDDYGNAAGCEAALVVVPAIPLACWDLNENGIGDPEEDTNADGEFDARDCQGPQGLTGPTGPQGGTGDTGISCWDLNENGEPDDDEDLNGDGIVDVADCQGAPGTDGEPGATGPEGPEGPPGPEGPAGQDAEPTEPQPTPDDDETAPRSPCGAFGMLGLPFTFLSLCATRITRRRRGN